MDWAWVADHLDLIWRQTGRNAYLGLLAVGFGLLISLPLGIACARFRWLYAPISALTTALYAVPSLAFFVVLLDYTGLRDRTIIIPLTIYTLSILVPAVVDGLSNVSDNVRQAATAMGYSPTRRLLAVELPIAVPVVIAGLRVATVSSLSLVSIGSLLGDNFGGLGYFFTQGFQLPFTTEIWVGIVAVVVLALFADLVLVIVGRLLTPWVRRRSRRRIVLQRRARAGAVAT
jgi:osmoprotectant transport system permease protein